MNVWWSCKDLGVLIVLCSRYEWKLNRISWRFCLFSSISDWKCRVYFILFYFYRILKRMLWWMTEKCRCLSILLVLHVGFEDGNFSWGFVEWLEILKKLWILWFGLLFVLISDYKYDTSSYFSPFWRSCEYCWMTDECSLFIYFFRFFLLIFFRATGSKSLAFLF